MKTKEMEQELGLTKHTIRYYEKEGFIHPQKDQNGYRHYTSEDVQTLQLVKFLRNLNISIDDIKLFMKGELSFDECLRVNQIHLEKQIQSLQEVKRCVQDMSEKQLPIIPGLEKIKGQVSHTTLGFNKTTQTVSLGRRLTRTLAIRQFICTLLFSLFLNIGVWFWVPSFFRASLLVKLLIFVISTLILFFVMIGMSTHVSGFSGVMADNSLNQSVEFIRDGIRFFEYNGVKNQIRYFFAVLTHTEEKMMHYYTYEDIEKVCIYTKHRYMSMMTPMALDVHVIDFEFYFRDGQHFYFYWPMILDDDARYIAYILEDKVANIIDKDNILYAMKHGINISDYMKKDSSL